MAIWRRTWNDKRTYFNTENALIAKQKSDLTVKLFGVTVISRKTDFDADSIDQKPRVGFKK